MDAKDLKIFMAVYEEKSINKAAQSIYMSSQGVGKVIRRLEAEMETTLFTRTSFGASPTEAGNILYGRAAEIISAFELLNQDMSVAASGKKSKLKAAFSYGVLPYVGISMLQRFREENPDIDFEYREETDERIEELFCKGEVHLGIVGGPVDEKLYEAIPFFSCRHVAIVNKLHPLAGKESIDYKDLEGETIVLVGHQFQPYHNNKKRLDRAGVRPKEMIETSEIAYTHIFAANNEGIGISVDFVAGQHTYDNTRVLPFADDTCRWDTYLVYPRKNVITDREERFINFALEYVRLIR